MCCGPILDRFDGRAFRIHQIAQFAGASGVRRTSGNASRNCRSGAYAPLLKPDGPLLQFERVMLGTWKALARMGCVQFAFGHQTPCPGADVRVVIGDGSDPKPY
jgi:hypothetical protein